MVEAWGVVRRVEVAGRGADGEELEDGGEEGFGFGGGVGEEDVAFHVDAGWRGFGGLLGGLKWRRGCGR